MATDGTTHCRPPRARASGLQGRRAGCGATSHCQAFASPGLWRSHAPCSHTRQLRERCARLDRAAQLTTSDDGVCCPWTRCREGGKTGSRGLGTSRGVTGPGDRVECRAAASKQRHYRRHPHARALRAPRYRARFQRPPPCRRWGDGQVAVEASRDAVQRATVGGHKKRMDGCERRQSQARTVPLPAVYFKWTSTDNHKDQGMSLLNYETSINQRAKRTQLT